MTSNILFYAFFFLLISPLFIHSSPIPDDSLSFDKRKVFVAFADFIGEVTGRVTLTDISGAVRVIGQCNTGFTDPNPKSYKIRIVYRPYCPSFVRRLDLLPPMKLFVNVDGSSAFQGDFKNFRVDEVIGMFVQVQLRNKIIGTAPIQAVQ